MGILDKMHIKNKKDDVTGRESEDLGLGVNTSPGSMDQAVQQEANRQADNLATTKDGIYENYGEEDEALVDEIEARALESYEATMYVQTGVDVDTLSDGRDEISEKSK